MESYIEIDKNMTVSKTVGDVPVVWHDVRQAPFALYGFEDPCQTPCFRRVPREVADRTSDGVSKLSLESAGGRVRFSTDSAYIAVRAKFRAVGRSPHLTLISTSGFDLYRDGPFGSRFVREFRMPYDMTDSYEQLLRVDGGRMQAYTVNFPIHAVVETLEIGLAPGARLEEGAAYRPLPPVVIYGSSIVHGTAATRPGNIYPAILSRMLDMDVRNLGFSGMANGEEALARWIATLPMSVFVCDYDHNSPDDVQLAATHYPFYETVRRKNPTLPYIMVTRPDLGVCRAERELTFKRRDVIMASYLRARAAGDQNVYFVDGLSFGIEPHSSEMTVDNCHPGDAGFVRMADAIGTVIRYALEQTE